MENLIAKLLGDFEHGKMTRRQLIQSLALAATAVSAASAVPAAAAPAGSDSTILKATYLNHVGYQVKDYAKSRDWYGELFGMKVALDDGKKANMAVGESLLIFHTKQSASTPTVDHVCLTIADWDTRTRVTKEKVAAELKRRGLEVRTTEGSFHFKDPDGFELQVGGKNQ